MKIRNKQLILWGIAWLVPFVLTVINLSLGVMPFWYDPARDLMQALGNLQKITLIGPPAGIPGIFYGPYWIWSLSFGLLISHDPRIVAFVVLTLPYFILFPLMLYKLKNVFGWDVSLLLWVLFITSLNKYAYHLWNPHPAYLYALITMFLLITVDYQKKKWQSFIKILIAGFTAGLLMNTHISFGLAFIVGTYIFLLTQKSRLKTLLLLTCGFLTAFLPFFVFELRHDFLQINTIIATLTSPTAVVKETSGDKLQIVQFFFGSLGQLLQLPLQLVYVIFFATVSHVFILFKRKKLSFQKEELKVLILVGSVSLALLAIYFSTKNPVWEYHFIGVEILFLMLLGILAKRMGLVKYALLGWVIVLSILGVINFTKAFTSNPYEVPSFTTKKHIVDTIYGDAQEKTISVYTYSPTTFTPDFDYLLLWQDEKHQTKKLIPDGKGEYVYLIIPWTTPDLKADFIDNRTPNEQFKTVKTWKIADQTEILKRVRYETK